MGEELLEMPTEGSVDMVVVQTRVVLVELKRTGVYFRIRTCRPCSQTGWWGEENRGGNTENKGEIFLGRN